MPPLSWRRRLATRALRDATGAQLSPEAVVVRIAAQNAGNTAATERVRPGEQSQAHFQTLEQVQPTVEVLQARCHISWEVQSQSALFDAALQPKPSRRPPQLRLLQLRWQGSSGRWKLPLSWQWSLQQQLPTLLPDPCMGAPHGEDEEVWHLRSSPNLL
mmetsp:Transcript_101292/g.182839  ORF Transcript_101292/g.182839 Transcript_101292/m.182839 type:complete len:159 (-) Transcript_101292:138-614(-)